MVSYFILMRSQITVSSVYPRTTLLVIVLSCDLYSNEPGIWLPTCSLTLYGLGMYVLFVILAHVGFGFDLIADSYI